MSQPMRNAGALALGALVVAIAALAIRPGPAAGAPTTDGEPALHSITVTGTGAVTRVPDVARVSVGVSVTKASVKGARDAAGKSMQAVIAAIKALGIDEKDIKTTSIDLSPQYSNSSTPKIIGYRMSEQLQVTVRDLDKAGDVVDTATAKGATEVNGLWFEVGDPASALDEARAAAIAQARTSAQKMASAAGVSLGGVVSISESVGLGARAVLLRRDGPRCRCADSGRARHAGRAGDGHGRLRDRLVAVEPVAPLIDIGWLAVATAGRVQPVASTLRRARRRGGVRRHAVGRRALLRRAPRAH